MTTDEPDEQLAPASPEDEARIRELLSEARATASMPTDVAARLDDALVGLAAERGVDPLPADNVVPITRTRRHRVVAVLGVAAAVAVFGLAIGTFSDQGSDDMGDAGSAGSVVDRGDDADFQESAADDAPDALETAPEGEAAGPRKDVYRFDDRAYPVRSGQLSRDLARIQVMVLPDPAAADYGRALVHAPKGFACGSPLVGRGILVGVRYDGGPAFVRFLEPMGDSQVVEVLQCRTGDLLRSTTLPTRG